MCQRLKEWCEQYQKKHPLDEYPDPDYDKWADERDKEDREAQDNDPRIAQPPF